MTYNEVLTAAINDLLENGYDSPKRIAYWTLRIEEAARSQLGSVDAASRELRETLISGFRRLVEQKDILQRHKGVAPFTLEKIREDLRRELDRRILASTDLIRLNREAAVDKTIRRFTGWSTSIPAGGTPVGDRVEIKQGLKREFASLPYEDRRLAIDQSHKLASAISSAIATDGGAIGAVWRSNWMQHGYDFREEHKRRDKTVFLIRDSWAAQQGLVKRGGLRYTDEIEQTAEFPFCRCYYVYLYNLSALPEECLTEKGKASLVLAKARMREMGIGT